MYNNKKRRPEESANPQIYYGLSESIKYSLNSRMFSIQYEMAKRCIQLLNLPTHQRCFLLDLGCGSGFSGEAITDAGHLWIGCDISQSMLQVSQAKETEGDLLHFDLGKGLNFRDCIFDGAISVSTLQWLCSCAKKEHNPWRRLLRFFESLFRTLNQGAKQTRQLILNQLNN